MVSEAIALGLVSAQSVEVGLLPIVWGGSVLPAFRWPRQRNRWNPAAFVGTGSVQIHGGMGFTWEHDAHLYFKRAKASEVLFGTSIQHRERVGVALGIAAA